uniref:U2266q n=1 Tax=Mycobacterium leprae TaxID=1769 RepID=Q50052_MYCLR|nr:u2266q [Mycobacterium leprae]
MQQLVCQWSTGVVPDLLARRAAKRRVTAISLVMLS